jgi:hypothetical protein
MEKLPELTVEGLGWELSDEVFDFEQARYLPFDSRDLLIAAEGTTIRSYADLIAVAKTAAASGKPSIRVLIIPMVVGG